MKLDVQPANHRVFGGSVGKTENSRPREDVHDRVSGLTVDWTGGPTTCVSRNGSYDVAVWNDVCCAFPALIIGRHLDLLG